MVLPEGESAVVDVVLWLIGGSPDRRHPGRRRGDSPPHPLSGQLSPGTDLPKVRFDLLGVEVLE